VNAPGRVDAASCATLSADLLRGAHLLRRSVEDAAGSPAGGKVAEVAEIADAMETLGHALHDFADAVRRGHHPGPGLPLPRTALRTAAREVIARLDPDPEPSPPAGRDAASPTPPLP